MADFTVYSIPGSPYGRAVLATLTEKNISFRYVAVSPPEFRREPHILRHRFGKVPVLQHDDFTLYETQAILRYLERVAPEPSLVPKEIRKLARMDQLLNIHDCYLFRGVGDTLGFERTVKPRVMGLPADEAIVEAAMPHAQRVFDELARLLGDQPFLVGDQITLADLLIAPLMDFFVTSPEWPVLTASHANLDGWLQRINQRDSMRSTTWDRWQKWQAVPSSRWVDTTPPTRIAALKAVPWKAMLPKSQTKPFFDRACRAASGWQVSKGRDR